MEAEPVKARPTGGSKGVALPRREPCARGRAVRSGTATCQAARAGDGKHRSLEGDALRGAPPDGGLGRPSRQPRGFQPWSEMGRRRRCSEVIEPAIPPLCGRWPRCCPTSLGSAASVEGSGLLVGVTRRETGGKARRGRQTPVACEVRAFEGVLARRVELQKSSGGARLPEAARGKPRAVAGNLARRARKGVSSERAPGAGPRRRSRGIGDGPRRAPDDRRHPGSGKARRFTPPWWKRPRPPRSVGSLERPDGARWRRGCQRPVRPRQAREDNVFARQRPLPQVDRTP